MIKIALQVLMILFSTQALFAQANEAVELDDFGQVNSETLESRLDYIGTSLLNNSSAWLQIMIYRGESDSLGSPYRRAAIMKSYLNDYRKISNDVSVTYCDTEKENRTRVWLLPAGASPQTCSPPSPNVFTATTLFDAFYNFDDAGCCAVNDFTADKADASLSAFAQELKRVSESKAYVYLYKSNWTGESHKSSFITKWRKTVMKRLAKEGIESSRIIVKYGGYRKESATMELWLIPKSSKIPKPKPD